MDITIYPKKLQGAICAIPSKSQAHRLLICAAFSDKPTTLYCPETNEDITATASCLNALGADITRTAEGYTVQPISKPIQQAVLPCKESGSTLRFLLPIACALGVSARFTMEGRLSQRPLSPLWEELERMGCTLSRPDDHTIACCGQLKSGDFTISGSVSSQFITGLLFAAALLPQNSRLHITGAMESTPYITMTQSALALFGVSTEGYRVSGGQRFRSPGFVTVEGDWSNGAFFLAAAALKNPVTVSGLAQDSPQGDAAAAELLSRLKTFCAIDAKDIPDLVPILSVVAAANHGAVFTHIHRLRLKESNRVASVLAMLHSLGISAEADHDTLTVHPGVFHGGRVDSANDHRIAMSAAIAATVATDPVTILDAQCVRKSYPKFWEDYKSLGGVYEQHIR